MFISHDFIPYDVYQMKGNIQKNLAKNEERFERIIYTVNFTGSSGTPGTLGRGCRLQRTSRARGLHVL